MEPLAQDPYNIIMAGVGGQGTVVASDILAAVGLAAGGGADVAFGGEFAFLQVVQDLAGAFEDGLGHAGEARDLVGKEPSAVDDPAGRDGPALVVVLGDQLDIEAAAFDGFDPAQDAVWMAEVAEESTHVWSHKARIAEQDGDAKTAKADTAAAKAAYELGCD